MPRSIATACGAGAVALALACSAALSAPAPAAPIIAKIVAAYGGSQVLDAIKSTRQQISLTILGQPGIVTFTELLPDKFVETISIPGDHVSVTTGFDGKNGWKQDTYGHVKPLTGDELTAAICQANDPMDAVMRPGASKAAVAVRPDQTEDGKRYTVLLVSQAGCPSTTLYVDPKTYLVSRLVADVQTTDFSNYATGPAGEKYPKTIAFSVMGQPTVGTVTSIEDNVSVDPSIFAMPSGSPAPSASP